MNLIFSLLPVFVHLSFIFWVHWACHPSCDAVVKMLHRHFRQVTTVSTF